MGRQYADSEELYRVRFTFTRPDGTTYERFAGPWPELSTARGQRTRSMQYRRSEQQTVATIERTTPVWEVVE